MTYKNKLIILSSALGVLVVLFAISIVFSPENAWKRAASGRLVQARTIDEIGSAEIRTASSDLVFTRSGKSWTVVASGATYPARKERIEAFAQALLSQSELFVVSKAKATWKNFEVGDDAANRITVKNAKGAVIGDFFVGKQAPTSGSVYVRIAGKDSVYQVGNGFSSYTANDTQYWENLRLLPEDFTERNIQSVAFKAQNLAIDDKKTVNAVYRITRGRGETWVVEGNPAFKADPVKVKTAVTRLSAFEGSEFTADPADQTGLGNPTAVISIAGDTGKGYAILVGAKKKDTGKFYVTLEGGTYVYLANPWTIEDAIQPLDSLKATAKKK
jgi:hypothetical protein